MRKLFEYFKVENWENPKFPEHAIKTLGWQLIVGNRDKLKAVVDSDKIIITTPTGKELCVLTEDETEAWAYDQILQAFDSTQKTYEIRLVAKAGETVYAIYPRTVNGKLRADSSDIKPLLVKSVYGHSEYTVRIIGTTLDGHEYDLPQFLTFNSINGALEAIDKINTWDMAGVREYINIHDKFKLANYKYKVYFGYAFNSAVDMKEINPKYKGNMYSRASLLVLDTSKQFAKGYVLGRWVNAATNRVLTQLKDFRVDSYDGESLFLSKNGELVFLSNGTFDSSQVIIGINDEYETNC